jgi:hypothetical protein
LPVLMPSAVAKNVICLEEATAGETDRERELACRKREKEIGPSVGACGALGPPRVPVVLPAKRHTNHLAGIAR